MAESRRTQMTKQLFRTALLELMQEKPFHKITIKEICEQADLNRTTFYLHYNDQNELRNEIISIFENDMVEYVSTFRDEDNKIDNMAKFLNYVKDNVVLYRVLMGSDIDGGAKTKIIRHVLGELKDDMPVFGNDLENKYVYTSMIEGTSSIITRWINDGFDLSPAELATLIYKLHEIIKQPWQ